MSAIAHLSFRVPALAVVAVCSLGSCAVAEAAPTTFGTWTIALGARSVVCRVMLRPRRTDAGDYFLGMPAACRHAMPGLQAVGRWAQPDATHLSLDDPAGKPVLVFAAGPGGDFLATAAEGSYRMRQVGPAEQTDASPLGFDMLEPRQAPGFATVQPIATRRTREAEPTETASDLAGRYAVMREKRDTGCMVTLDDKSRGAGGSRAALAPGCRDQGIVIFDPSGWRVVKGELVLTARAGHKTALEKHGEGLWEKNTKDGGKPIGLKKL